MILQNGSPRPATASLINVTGNWMSRTITWNDNTSPASLSYQREGSSLNFYYYPVQNQESGFRIYHKEFSGSWD